MQLTRCWALGKGFKPTCVSPLLSWTTSQINSVNIGFIQSASMTAFTQCLLYISKSQSPPLYNSRSNV